MKVIEVKIDTKDEDSDLELFDMFYCLFSWIEGVTFSVKQR
jgi:hypothetical protein